VLGVSAVAVSIAVGVEPSGHVIWDVAPVETGRPGSAVRVRVRLESVGPLHGARLRPSGPEGVSFRPVALSGRDDAVAPERDGDGAVVLGDLEGGRPVLLEFEFVLPPGTGGIAGFTLSGSLPDGRPVEEAVGWTLAAPRAPPHRRHGAAEYPAVLRPDDPR
jgi:hypothetical protein